MPSVGDGEDPVVYQRAAKLGGDLEGLVQREGGEVEQKSIEEIHPTVAL